MIADNPADRLHKVLKRGKEFQRTDNARLVWQSLLQTEDEALLLIRIGKLAQLPGQIIEILQDEHGDPDDWSHWYSQVRHAFTQNSLQSTWQSFISHIDDHSMRALSMSARLIGAHAGKDDVDFDKLSKLREGFQAAYFEILKDTTIEVALRKYLARSLQRIISAIDEYAIRGIDGVNDAVEVLAAGFVLNGDLKEKVKTTESVKKAFVHLRDLMLAVSVMEKFPELATTVASLLTSGH